MNKPRDSWDRYNQEVEEQSERQRQAVRKFMHREREPRPLTQSQKLALAGIWFFAKIFIACGTIGGLVYLSFSQGPK